MDVDGYATTRLFSGRLVGVKTSRSPKRQIEEVDRSRYTAVSATCNEDPKRLLCQSEGSHVDGDGD